jgi:hypothetical protein
MAEKAGKLQGCKESMCNQNDKNVHATSSAQNHTSMTPNFNPECLKGLSYIVIVIIHGKKVNTYY